MSTAKERIALNLNAVKAQSIKNENLELNLAGDINQFEKSAFDKVMSGNDNIKQSHLNFKLAENAFNKVIELSDKAIIASKDLGIDTKSFESRKADAKSMLSKVQSGQKINIVL